MKFHSLHISKVFILDALGACLTALLLSQLLARFVDFFGMPKTVLFPLALIAAVFALYSFIMFLVKGGKVALKIIAVANLAYCILSSTLVLHYFYELTAWGILYFAGEIVIVFSLSLFEWRRARVNE